MRMPSRSDSSRRPSPAMPSSFRSRTSSAICPMRRALFTWYGISVTMMDERPVFSSVSTVARARTVRMPRPSRYASRIGPCPQMKPAVGKSGPGMYRISSSTVSSGCSISATSASHTSPRLWGGMLVAMPTAMPAEPLISRFGTLLGRTSGSCVESSKLGTKVTVSLSMSASSSSASSVRRHSV